MRHYKKPKKKPLKKKPLISYQLSKEITKSKLPEVKRDTCGNVLYSSQYIGDEKFEYWIDYNDDRQPVSYRDSRGNEWKCKYNSNGNISNFWDNTGYEEVYNYYKNDVVISTDSYGIRIRKVIDRERCKITRDVFLNTP